MAGFRYIGLLCMYRCLLYIYRSLCAYLSNSRRIITPNSDLVSLSHLARQAITKQFKMSSATHCKTHCKTHYIYIFIIYMYSYVGIYIFTNMYVYLYIYICISIQTYILLYTHLFKHMFINIRDVFEYVQCFYSIVSVEHFN